jgi:hypothetical protein
MKTWGKHSQTTWHLEGDCYQNLANKNSRQTQATSIFDLSQSSIIPFCAY